MPRGKVIRGKEAIEIVQELLDGWSQDQIAEHHNRPRISIENWIARHRDEIEASKAERKAVLKGSWLSDQVKRRAELEAKYDELGEVINGLRDEFFVEDQDGSERFTMENYEEPEEARKTIALWARLQQTQILIINKAAEESGDLPQRKRNEGGQPEEVSWEADGVGDDV